MWLGWHPINMKWKIIHSCSKPPTRKHRVRSLAAQLLDGNDTLVRDSEQVEDVEIWFVWLTNFIKCSYVLEHFRGWDHLRSGDHIILEYTGFETTKTSWSVADLNPPRFILGIIVFDPSAAGTKGTKKKRCQSMLKMRISQEIINMNSNWYCIIHQDPSDFGPTNQNPSKPDINIWMIFWKKKFWYPSKSSKICGLSAKWSIDIRFCYPCAAG